MDNSKSAWSVEFYTVEQGGSPVLEFINGLTPTERAKIQNHIRLLREFGTTLGMPHARPLKGHKPLWELRPMPNRLIYFAFRGRRFIILHAFTKKKDQTPRNEIRTALGRRATFLEDEK